MSAQYIACVTRTFMLLCSASAVWLAGSLPLAAEPGRKGIIHLELNKTVQVQAGCRTTLVARNIMGNQVERFAIEVVLFDGTGGVLQVSQVDLGALPAGRTVVRQFDFAETACNEFDRLLINAVTACDGAAQAAEACTNAVEVSHRSGAPEFVF